jgi:hypothetical protein
VIVTAFIPVIKYRQLDIAGINAAGRIGAMFELPFVVSEDVEDVEFIAEYTCEDVDGLMCQLLDAV